MPQEFLFAYALVMALIMQLAYNHIGKKYRDKKRESIENSFSFRVFYLILRISYAPILYLALFRGILAFPPPPTLVLLGLISSFIGAAIFIYPKAILGENYSPCYDSLAPHSIIQRGIYRYIRHPIYSANILNLIGVACFSGSLVFIAQVAILGFYYRRSAQREELALQRLFPEYGAYQRRAGMFLPKLKRANG